MSALDRRSRKRVGGGRSIRFLSLTKTRKAGRKVMVPVSVEDITQEKLKNNRIQLRAKDPETGDKLFKFPKKSEVDLLQQIAESKSK